MPFPDVVRTLEKWLDAFGAESDPILLRSGRRVLTELAALRGSLLSEEDCRAENETDRQALTFQRIAACSPSRVFREKYFLHLFSGRRRRGDLQDALEALSPEPGVVLCCHWISWFQVNTVTSSKRTHSSSGYE